MKLLLLDSFSLILGGIILVLKVTESPIQSKLIRLNNYINLISRPSYLTESSEWFRSCGSTNNPVVRPLTQWPSTPTESMTEPSFKTMIANTTEHYYGKKEPISDDFLNNDFIWRNRINV